MVAKLPAPAGAGRDPEVAGAGAAQDKVAAGERVAVRAGTQYVVCTARGDEGFQVVSSTSSRPAPPTVRSNSTTPLRCTLRRRTLKRLLGSATV